MFKEKTELVWKSQHSQAGEDLNGALIQVTMTKIFDPDPPPVLKIDASKYAIGAVLEHKGHPVSFESRRRLEPEIFYPAFESELLAIVCALIKWARFLGTPLVPTETDNGTLNVSLVQKARDNAFRHWLYKLADSDIKVDCKPECRNLVTDALRRRRGYVQPISILKEVHPHQYPRRGVSEGIQRRIKWEEAYNRCSDLRDIASFLVVGKVTGKTLLESHYWMEEKSIGAKKIYCGSRSRTHAGEAK